MSFADFGVPRGAQIPEHGRLRGLEVGNPHPQYSLTEHDHADVYEETGHEHSSVPLGYLDSAQVTADQPGITGLTPLTDLEVTVTVAAGRRLKISMAARGSNTGANSNLIYITKDGSIIQTSWYVASTVAESFPPVFALDEPSAGAHTYALSADVGGGTMTLRASSAGPAILLVEDIGAA